MLAALVSCSRLQPSAAAKPHREIGLEGQLVLGLAPTQSSPYWAVSRWGLADLGEVSREEGGTTDERSAICGVFINAIAFIHRILLAAAALSSFD